jgi:hypothetical protein
MEERLSCCCGNDDVVAKAVKEAANGGKDAVVDARANNAVAWQNRFRKIEDGLVVADATGDIMDIITI